MDDDDDDDDGDDARDYYDDRSMRAVVPMASASASDGARTQRRRMLALHGKGGNAASFERALRPLVDATRDAWEWTFIDGTVPEPNPGGRGWWTLRPGERTYSATELPGVEESKALVRSTGPWDGVFGFSQGAMLAALVAADDASDDGFTVCDCAIIVGAAWPTCEASKLESMSSARLRSLHVIGSQDAINPPAQARRVAAHFGEGAARIFEHDGGHIVPMDADALNAYKAILDVE